MAGNTLTLNILIHRLPGDVFAFVSDYTNDTRWRKGVTSMTLQPAGIVAIGTEVREVLQMMGTTIITDSHIDQHDPDRMIGFKSFRGPYPTFGTRVVTPEGGGTRLVYELTVEPRGLMGLLSFITGPMFKRQVEGDLARLKGLLEAAS